MVTDQERIKALEFENARLQQEVSRQPRGRVVGGRKTETKIVTFWKVVRSNKLALSDEELAERWDQMMTEMEDDGWKLAHILNSSTSNYTERLVFERPHGHKGQGKLMFNMNDLLYELRKLTNSDVPWTMLQKMQLKHLPEGFTDWVDNVRQAIDPRCQSGHLIPAHEMALILMRVWMAALPDEKCRSTWQKSVRSSRLTGNGQYQLHMESGAMDRFDDYMEELGLDPGWEEKE